MPLTDATLITVTATYTQLDGNPARGKVFFSSSQVLVNTTSNEIVEPVDFVAELDSGGSISIDLPATDDADFDPSGWVYQVSEQTTGGNRPVFNLSLPHDGGSVDLSDVAPPGPAASAESTLYTPLSKFTAHREAWGGDPPNGSADDLLGLDANNLPKIAPGDTYGLRHEYFLGEFGDLGSTYLSTLINNALTEIRSNGGGKLVLPHDAMVGGQLDLDVPVDLSGSGVSARGASKNGTTLVGDGVPALQVASTESWIRGTLRDMRLQATNAHVVELLGTMAVGSMGGMYLKVNTSGFHAYHQDSTSAQLYQAVDMLYEDLLLEGLNGGGGASDEPLWYVSTEGTYYNSNNHNRWRTHHCDAPHLYFESRAAQACLADNDLNGINAETSESGGILRMFGCRGWGVKNVVGWDLTGPIGATQVRVGEGPSGAPSRHNTIERYVRHGGGTMPAGLYDIQLDTAAAAHFTTLVNCGREASGGEPHVHSLGDAVAVVINPGQQDTYDKASRATFVGDKGTLQQHIPEATGRFYAAPATGPTVDVTPTNERMLLVPYEVHRDDAVLDALAVNVTTAGETDSVLRLGVYDHSDGLPNNLLLDAGTVAGDSTGSKTLTGLATPLPRGVVWVCACVQGAPSTAPTIRGTQDAFVSYVSVTNVDQALGSLERVALYQDSVSGALPDPASVNDLADFIGPKIAARFTT